MNVRNMAIFVVGAFLTVGGLAADGVDRPMNDLRTTANRSPIVRAIAARRQPENPPPAKNSAEPPAPEPLPTPEEPRPPLLPEDKPLRSITTNIRPTSGKLPENVAAQKFQAIEPLPANRPWSSVVYTWEAPAFCHRPLYFEDVNVERYGYTHCHVLQPFCSAAHFFGSTLALPYTMTVHPPHECVYPLGHYRPGSPVPYRCHGPEWRADAGLVEGAAITGLILLIP